MKTKLTTQFALRNLRILTGLFSVAALAFVALFAAANATTRGEAVRTAGVTRRAFMRVTPQGVIQSQSAHSGNSQPPSAGPRMVERRMLGPLRKAVWHYNHTTAIAELFSIDANNVWGAWLLSGARLT